VDGSWCAFLCEVASLVSNNLKLLCTLEKAKLDGAYATPRYPELPRLTMVVSNSAARVRPIAAVKAWVWLALLLTAAALPVAAQSESPVLGTSASGLRGLAYTALPLSAKELNLSASAGYGFTEAFNSAAGVTHRGQAGLGVSVAPLPWLAFALRFDGRLEAHPDDAGKSHSAGFGDPRLFARAGRALTPELSVGGELTLWLPGTDAPSIEWKAATVDARGLIAFTPNASPWVLLGALGFRLDNSAEAAPDLRRLRVGDRISLGLSASDAALLAVGLARKLDSTKEVFGELSTDVLVGTHAPRITRSPVRAVLGGRYFFAPAWQAELTAHIALGERPRVRATDALVPIEPRVLLLAAVRYSFGLSPVRAATVAEAGEVKTAPAAVMPKTALLSGLLLDDHGAPLPEAAVTLRYADATTRETITNADGRYTFRDVPLGAATVEVVATGFETQTWQVDLQPTAAEEPARKLAPKLEEGVLRGLIRTFRSVPLRAEIVVRDARGKSVATRESHDDGSFEIELAKGSYRVTVSARGYKSHSREIKIQSNGVSIVNVDLREASP
jgi:hypothetical protein